MPTKKAWGAMTRQMQCGISSRRKRESSTGGTGDASGSIGFLQSISGCGRLLRRLGADVSAEYSSPMRPRCSALRLRSAGKSVHCSGPTLDATLDDPWTTPGRPPRRVAHTIIERHIKVKGEANPFDPRYTEYFERRRSFAWRTYPCGKAGKSTAVGVERSSRC